MYNPSTPESGRCLGPSHASGLGGVLEAQGTDKNGLLKGSHGGHG